MTNYSTDPDLPALLGGTPLRPAGPPPWPQDWPDVRAAVERSISDGSWGRYHGPNWKQLERALSEFHDTSEVLLCSSGTSAIELALRGARVGDGDEVILAAYDFKANFQNVLTMNATPVLVDVEPDSWQLDVSQLEQAVSDRTKVIIASHLHGGFVAMDAVMKFASQHGLTVIEDACQCPGALLHDRRAGTVGDVGVLSFGGSKLLTAGRGGAVITNRPEIAQRIRLYTQRGNEAYPLSELQAAVLVPQLQRLDEFNAKRLHATESLAAPLSAAGLSPLFKPTDRTVPGFYKLGLQYDADEFDGLSRDQFSAALRAEGVAVDVGFRSLHRIHSRRRFRAVGDLDNADRADAGILVLHHPVLLEDQPELDQIIAAIAKVRRHASELSRQPPCGP